MSTAYVLSQDVGKKAACEALAVARATYYRHMSSDFSGAKIPSCACFGPHKARKRYRDRYPPFGAFPG
jgi:hypothetical protein